MGYFEDSVSGVDRSAITLGRKKRFWREREPIVSSRGEIREIVKGGMWDYQKTWWNLPNFIKILVGGYGSGKTLIGSKRIISLALQNAPAPVAVVSPTFPLARQTVIATITALLAGKQTLLGRRAFWWRYNKSTHEFHIRYHGRRALIIVYSGEDPLSLRGPNLAAAWLDEPFIMDKEVFEQMIARVRHPDAMQKEVNLTGTPEQLNWGYDLAVGEDKDNQDVGLVRASTRGNKALDPGYVKRLEGVLSAKAIKAYIDGNFINLAQGQVFYGFSPDKNVKKLEIPEGAELGAGMDFNVNPMSATVFWKLRDHIHYIDEIELPNADTEYLCGVLKERYVDAEEFKNRPLVTIYPDATGSARASSAPGGKSDFWYIRDAGFEVFAPHKSPKRRDSFNCVNGRLEPKKGEPTITMEPTCKKLIKYLSVYSHDELTKQEKMSHLLDAFRYPPTYLFPVQREHVQVAKLTGH